VPAVLRARQAEKGWDAGCSPVSLKRPLRQPVQKRVQVLQCTATFSEGHIFQLVDLELARPVTAQDRPPSFLTAPLPSALHTAQRRRMTAVRGVAPLPADS